MAGTPIVLDGLWRCLCPAVDATALLRAVHASGRPAPPALLRRRPRTAGPRTCTRTATQRAVPGPAGGVTGLALPQLRRVHTGATARVGRVGLLSDGAAADAGRVHQPSRAAHAARALPQGPEGHDMHHYRQQQQQQLLATHALLQARPPYRRELTAAPTPAIYAALRQLQDRPGAFSRIQIFARFLLEERDEAPTAALYEALLRANCHTCGSADAVRDVLRALRAGQIEGTPGLFHGALAVLAVHPDYLLRAAVLRAMRARWIDLAPDGVQSVALGCLRDGQYERALDQLEAMAAAAATAATAGAPPVPAWLLDIYIYVLGDAGFLDDALGIVNHRLLRDDDAVPLAVWAFLLDACCRRGHYEGLAYVWNRAVRPTGGGGGGGSHRHGLLAPSDATALDVLTVAARHGDANLAAAVMQMLAARGTRLGLPHFEAMLDCYAQAGLVGRALQALCIMHNAGIEPDQGSTRSIFLRLVGGDSDKEAPAAPPAPDGAPATPIEAAVESLFDLRKQYGSVPVAAFNVVVEAMLARGRRDGSRVSAPVGPGLDGTGAEAEAAALDLYRHVRQLCPAGPNRATFRLLFASCTDPRHLAFLLHEMRAFALQPDMHMVDRVVYANACSGSLDEALGPVYDLMGAGASGDGGVGGGLGGSAEQRRRQPWISRQTAAALAKRCIDEEDARIWEVADASREHGRPMDTILQALAAAAAGRGAAQQRQPAARSNAYGVPRPIDGGAEDEEPQPSSAGLP